MGCAGILKPNTCQAALSYIEEGWQMKSKILVLIFAAGLFVLCTGYDSCGGIKGDKCIKSADCMNGLLCVNNKCESQLVVQDKQTKEDMAAQKAGGEGKGVWVDPATGYKWQNPPSTHAMKWSEAVDYCKKLQHAGHTDWRLPTIGELKTLLTKEKINGCYWKAGLTGECHFYWSSSSNTGDKVFAKFVYFSSGNESYDNKTEVSHVRCLRKWQ